MDISPYVAIAIPAIVMLLRNLIPLLADSRIGTLLVVAALGALSALAETLGVPLGTDGHLLTGLVTGMVGVGGVEAAKTVPMFRRANRSSERNPHSPPS